MYFAVYLVVHTMSYKTLEEILMIVMFISSHFQKETKAYNCKCNFLRHLLYFPASLLGFPSVFSAAKFPFFLIAPLQNMNTAFVFTEPMWRASRIDVSHKSVGCAFLAGCCMVAAHDLLLKKSPGHLWWFQTFTLTFLVLKQATCFPS